MSEFLEEALKKLEEAKRPKGLKAGAVFKPMVEALKDFCRQDGEFAQAVAQGGDPADCAEKAVESAGASISDIEVYKRAAAFYFPGCVVTMKLSIAMSEHDAAQADTTANRPVVLDLADFW